MRQEDSSHTWVVGESEPPLADGQPAGDLTQVHSRSYCFPVGLLPEG